MKTKLPLFEDFDGIYNYCPSIIEENNKRHIFYCSNLIPYKIIDYIAYREGTLNKNNQYDFSNKAFVLEPDVYNKTNWDHVHVCDPSVIAGQFYINNNSYKYCLSYLGCNTLDCTINEIGLAFSNNLIGPWIKYPHNPYISFSLEENGRYWGVGQPSIVSIDKKSKFRLFYTKGDENGSHTFYVDCDFSLQGNGRHTTPIMVKEAGLIVNGKVEELTNGDFMYDEDSDGYYLVRDARIRDNTYPSIISPFVQVAFSFTNSLTSNSINWEIIENIDENKTGFKRNHNAGFVRNLYGWKPSNKEIEVIYTNSILASSNEDLKYLWNYRLNSYKIEL